ncbi:thiamine-phosphate synthase [Alicyclobacillus cellulosilyticus]|uniref:Thiamine-phosphate synthase n=1 Tax=Alicyclobacillus cellulosilyticus TaxID=1003997 RepID=A0A917K7B4_9BACL|nr:thiamine phosphate synthase [Alicyclobacillus cellulosilyticus]GGJ01714.1 thiamine-phosphate synthase [Alicyclobacillus cellulosilyticus]
MSFVLHVVSDPKRTALPLFEALVQSARGGADILQVRDKKAPAAETFAFCTRLLEAVRHHGAAPGVIVNDRVDVAMAAGAHGVHLAAKSLPPGAVRRLRAAAGWAGVIGCSVHSYEAAVAAAEQGADYITFGHVFASESHPGVPPRGLHELRRIVEAVPIPVVAIGGIDRTNLDLVLETGVSGIAVIGAVLAQDDPCRAASALKEAMAKSRAKPRHPFPRLRGGEHDATTL